MKNEYTYIYIYDSLQNLIGLPCNDVAYDGFTSDLLRFTTELQAFGWRFVGYGFAKDILRFAIYTHTCVSPCADFLCLGTPSLERKLTLAMNFFYKTSGTISQDTALCIGSSPILFLSLSLSISLFLSLLLYSSSYIDTYKLMSVFDCSYVHQVCLPQFPFITADAVVLHLMAWPSKANMCICVFGDGRLRP